MKSGRLAKIQRWLGNELIEAGRKWLVRGIGPLHIDDPLNVRVLDFDRAHVWLYGRVTGDIGPAPHIPSHEDILAMIAEKTGQRRFYGSES